MNNFGRFMESVTNLAATSPRQEVTAPTSDQVAIAAGILRLADAAERTVARIGERRMTRDEWNEMADAYQSIASLAAVQGLEAPIVDAPVVSEIEGPRDANPQ